MWAAAPWSTRRRSTRRYGTAHLWRRIDVWYDYPVGGSTAAPARSLSHVDNILMTPHSSGLTRQTFEGRAADIAGNISRLLAGEPLQNVVAVAR